MVEVCIFVLAPLQQYFGLDNDTQLYQPKCCNIDNYDKTTFAEKKCKDFTLGRSKGSAAAWMGVRKGWEGNR